VPVVRGMTKEKPFLLSSDANCLSDKSVEILIHSTELMDKAPHKIAHIKGIGGETSKRRVVRVWILDPLNSGPIQVYADIVTGTLYMDDGECLSSDKRKVIKWSRYVRPARKRSNPRVAKRNVGSLSEDAPQRKWNEGI